MTQITIDRVVHNGYGLGKLPDGKSVFVPYVLDDETVEIDIVENKKDYAIAELKDLINKSRHRITPRCKYYTRCGGCHLQHTNYENQLIIKKNAFLETIKRIYSNDFSESKLEVYKSPKEFHYRHTVRLKVSPSGHIGFNKLKSDTIEPVDSCLLAHEKINSLIANINNSPQITKSLKHIESISIEICPLTNKLHLILISSTKNVHAALNSLINLPLDSLKVMFSNGVLYSFSRDSINYRSFPLFDKILCVKPGTFMQHNWDVNLMIIDYLKALLRDTQLGSIVDFHAGAGNFILPLGVYFKRKMACDVNMQALSDLKNNMKGWGQEIELHHLSAEDMLNMLVSRGEKVDVIILDPPRGGCKDLCYGLKDLKPSIIIYVSCDPPALARDLKILKGHGYSPIKIALFDMFPQTFHIESVTILGNNV